LRNSRERFVQEILDRGFLIELVKVAPVPFIARVIEVRKMRQRDCSSRQKRGHGRVWGALGPSQSVHDPDGRESSDYYEQKKAPHEDETVAAVCDRR
jgi:hypothetical protein